MKKVMDIQFTELYFTSVRKGAKIIKKVIDIERKYHFCRQCAFRRHDEKIDDGKKRDEKKIFTRGCFQLSSINI